MFVVKNFRMKSILRAKVEAAGRNANRAHIVALITEGMCLSAFLNRSHHPHKIQLFSSGESCDGQKPPKNIKAIVKTTER